MNPIDYCDVAQSFWIEEGKDYQSEIIKYATGSSDMNMDMNMNTDMNKNTVDDLNCIEQCFSLPEPTLQPLDSQEYNTHGFQEVDVINGETTIQPSFDLPFDYTAQNGSMDNMLQDDNRNDSFSSESKRLKQDYQSSCPFEIKNRFLYQFSNSSIAGYPSVQRNESSSPVYGYGGEDSVDDSTNGIYTEGQEGLVAKDDDEQENYDNGRMIRQWTEQEMDLLEEGVKLYGTKNNWKKIAAHIGGRSASQCVNKWKNRRSEKWKKWNKDATKVLEELINRGLSFEEIQKRMSDYTYIQIYQHHQKLTMNNGPWEDWEVKLLIKLKKEGKFSDTDIGKKLNNRHKDSVKCKWNEMNKK